MYATHYNWEGLKNGKCGIDFITNFDNTDMKVKVAGEVKNFDPTLTIEKKETKRMELLGGLNEK